MKLIVSLITVFAISQMAAGSVSALPHTDGSSIIYSPPQLSGAQRIAQTKPEEEPEEELDEDDC